jgi:hypothetical protein
MCQTTDAGYIVKAGSVAGVGPVAGVANFGVNNTTGSNGDKSLDLNHGVFARPNSSTSPVTQASYGKTIYAEDDEVVSSDSSLPVAGTMWGFTEAGEVIFAIGSCSTALSALAAGSVSLPLNGFYLNDGTPLAAFADADSPTPGLSFNDSKAASVRWNNHGTPGQIVTSFDQPPDMDVGAASYVVLLASKVGATAADQPTFGVGVFEQQVGAAYDAGSDLGGTTNAINGESDGATKEVQQLQLTIAADSFSASADGATANPAGTFDLLGADRSVTLTLQPEAGELGTDDLILHSARLVYTRVI